MNDMEFLASQAPKEAPPAARPQHLKFCRDLLRQRDWDEMAETMPDSWLDLLQAILKGEDVWNNQPILRQDVNKLVDELKKCPEAAKPMSVSSDLEDGIYRKADGTIFRVYYNLAETHLLAKRLVIVDPGDKELGKKAKVKWVYAGAAGRFVNNDERMPYDEAKEFGALYGMCVFGHPLNDPVSIHLGIGPVCGGRQFGEEFHFMVEQAKLELKNG
jgi:Family of unknown function (DUF6011)